MTRSLPILVVDDNAVSRQLLMADLERTGHEVIPAENAARGLEILQRGKQVGLVITDIQMPGMDGFALIAALRATPQGASVPIVISSAFPDAEGVARAASLGIRHFLVKPIRFAQLRQTLDAVLAAPPPAATDSPG